MGPRSEEGAPHALGVQVMGPRSGEGAPLVHSGLGHGSALL